MWMSVILIGYRGSGKSTVGRKLADRLWQTFIDTDELIAKKSNKTIKQIFETDGEQRFREMESEALQQVCKLEEHVISLGGGAVLLAENRELLKSTAHKRIYLRCDPAVLHERIIADPQTAATRPSLTALGGSVDEIRQLLAQREPLYREVMTAELEVTSLSPDEAMIYVTKLM
jgi:shikimate kinase